ncbi:hypothetical protein NDU88_007886 [Pleurodeles waltl]|uniref:Uncharacterized protein n=1 Tax=Pleurodeles waltl TaxID=8319 RepID=A0AAV7VVN6_PLEWA|nr:hypothetical protein NDU88_007886 [Pleurodeles waltl]
MKRFSRALARKAATGTQTREKREQRAASSWRRQRYGVRYPWNFLLDVAPVELVFFQSLGSGDRRNCSSVIRFISDV